MAARHGALGCQAACVIFIVLTWLVMAARFYARGRITRSIGADDWVMLFTAVVFTGFSTLVYNLANMVLYSDMTQLQTLFLAVRLLFAAFQLYIALTIIVKIALILFFIRLFPRATHPKQRWIILVSGGLYVVLGVAIFFLSLYDCGRPTQYIENSLQGKCITKRRHGLALSYVFAILNAVTDWIFVGVPVFAITSMQLTKRKRISAVVLVALGAIGSLCSVVRVAYIHQLSGTPQQVFQTAESMATLSIVEIGLGIIAVSLATLRPLISKMNIRGFEHNVISYLSKKSGGAGSSRAAKPGGSLGRTPDITPGVSAGTVASDEEILQPPTPLHDFSAEEKQLGLDKPAADMQVRSFAVINESDFETPGKPTHDGRDAVQEGDKEGDVGVAQETAPGPARGTGRWSNAPRISMSWMRSSMRSSKNDSRAENDAV